MSYYENYNLQSHAKSDKVKWIIVFIALILLFAGVVAAIIPAYTNVNKRKVVIDVNDADMVASFNTNDKTFILGDVRVSISRGYGSIYPNYPADDTSEVRAYAGNIITISTNRGNIENVEFITDSHDNNLNIHAMEIDPDSNVWKYRAGDEVKTDGHAKITSIIVYYSFKGDERPQQEQSSTDIDPGPEVVENEQAQMIELPEPVDNNGTQQSTNNAMPDANDLIKPA